MTSLAPILPGIGAEIARRDFKKQTLRLLDKRGVTLLGVVALPGNTFSDRGYSVFHNGAGRVLRFDEVVTLALS